MRSPYLKSIFGERSNDRKTFLSIKARCERLSDLKGEILADAAKPDGTPCTLMIGRSPKIDPRSNLTFAFGMIFQRRRF